MMLIKEQTKARRIIAICITLICFLAMSAPLMVSAGSGTGTAVIKVEQIFETNEYAPEDVDCAIAFTMTALNGAPLPASAKSGVYTFVIDGTASVDTDPITFTKAGVFSYEIKVDPSLAAKGYTYDKSVYIVDIYVANGNNGLNAEVTVRNGGDTKVEKVIFSNEYRALPSDPLVMVDPPVKKTVTGTPSKKGTDRKSTRLNSSH